MAKKALALMIAVTILISPFRHLGHQPAFPVVYIMNMNMKR